MKHICKAALLTLYYNFTALGTFVVGHVSCYWLKVGNTLFSQMLLLKLCYDSI